MSTTVSNPYSFNIVNNKSFSSPTIQPNLPQTNTLLADISRTYNRNYNLTIPSGVNVIYCSGYVSAGTDERNGSCDANLIIKNNINNKYWHNDRDAAGGGDYISVYCDCYIGVTPGKTYNLYIDTSSFFDGDPGYEDSDVKIYYSASINQKTPTVTDY